MLTKLFLIRHGETDWNAEKRIQGSLERSLNERGKEQAHQLGKDLTEIPFVAVYSSTMRRARETAEIVAAYHNLDVNLEPALREAAYGTAEGLVRDEFESRYQDRIEKRYRLTLEERLTYRIIPDQENGAEIAARALYCLKAIAQRHRGSHVLVVSHGFVMRTIISVLGQCDDRLITIPNAGVVQMESDGVALRLVSHGFINQP